MLDIKCKASYTTNVKLTIHNVNIKEKQFLMWENAYKEDKKGDL